VRRSTVLVALRTSRTTYEFGFPFIETRSSLFGVYFFEIIYLTQLDSSATVLHVIHFSDFGRFLKPFGADSVATCRCAALSTRGWNTPAANSSLVILAGCFLNFTFFMVTL